VTFEILEHTADVGLRVRARTLEECFQVATWGLASIMGIDEANGEGETVEVDVRAGDIAALLADWLSEVLYVHEARDAAITSVEVRSVAGGRAEGAVILRSLGDRAPQGTQVKAVTYHQLRVAETPEGCEAQVYFDV
jgi:SHS2 domain-containing protein